MPRPSTGRPRSGTVEKLPSGRYRARFTGPDGARHKAPVTFEDVKAARLWLDRELRSIESDPEAWLSPEARAATRRVKPLTFGEYAEQWLAGRKVRGRPLADRTRDHYRDLLDKHILPAFGDLPIAEITHDHVDNWYERTLVERPTLRSHAYSLLRTILGTAVDRGIVKTANPAKIRGAGNVERAHKVMPATLTQLEDIVQHTPERRRLMILLAAWCALRFGELTELRRSDIDTKAGVIRVRRGVVRVRETTEDGARRYVRKAKTPKSAAGARDVAIPPHLLPLVRQHLLEHAAPGKDGLLFPGRVDRDDNGTVTAVQHLSSSAFYGHVAILNPDGTVRRKGDGYYEARRQAGRSDLRFHDLRHTGAVLAAQTGATLAELMNRLGHSTPGAAMRYQHAAAERDQEIARRLSAMVGDDK
jgi:integrase